MPPIKGNVLGDLARTIAAEIGPYQLASVSQGAGDASHVFLAGTIDTEAPADRHSGEYLYSHGPSVVGQQQRIARGGFLPGVGYYTLVGSFTAQILPGTPVSLLGTMPWIDQDGLTGLRTCINRSLRTRWVVDRYPITSLGPTVDAYDLGALWWMTERRARRLYGPAPPGTGHPEVAATSWRVRQDGETWVLELGSGFPTGEVFFLECEQPASARLYDAATAIWAYTAGPTVGMTSDGDACLGAWNDAYQTALYEVFRQLAIQAGGTRKTYWRDRAQTQRLVCSSIALWNRDSVAEVAGETAGLGGDRWGAHWGTKGLFLGPGP